VPQAARPTTRDAAARRVRDAINPSLLQTDAR
jgi:hypothetical protein